MKDFELADLLDTANKNMKGVHPKMRQKVLCIIQEMYQDGIRFSVHTGMRSYQQQAALYAQGRESLQHVNEMRRRVGYYRLSTKENRYRVTWVKFSWHNTGLAVDLVEDGSSKRGIQWSWRNIKNFHKIGKYAKKHGLQWGGWWRKKDWPHLQYPVKLTLKQASQLSIRKIWEHIK
jgi:peptidoglycan L-alanyl-D-glutamate endopeptidase CwlK